MASTTLGASRALGSTAAERLITAVRRKSGAMKRLVERSEPAPAIETDDVQGIVFRGYGRLPCCHYAFLQVREPIQARAWIARVASQVAAGTPRAERFALHLAFTYSGLAALGLPERALRGFSREFIEGMYGDHRSRFLGDVGESAPERWAWGGPTSETVHAVLMVYGADRAATSERFQAEQELWRESGWADVHALPTCPRSGREHFGFADGISQPAIEGYHEASSTYHRVRAGEFILGYPNEYGLYTDRPLVDGSRPGALSLPADVEGSTLRDFGRNGTYLVMRQLRQDVVAFRETLDALTRNEDGSPNVKEQERLAAQMVGRWPSGAPLMASPHQDDPSKARENDFGYHREDREGLSCPVGAHVRRANPRDALEPSPGTEESLTVNRRHRMLRRGRIYGGELPPGAVDNADRGLMFVAVNANISRQFEFVQHSWIVDPRFNGMFGESDPITGASAENIFRVPGNPVRTRCVGLPRFVSVVGGAYFFLPGIRALRFLGEAEGFVGKPGEGTE